ncbi:MAG: amidase [Pseudomonadota bacterium]
MIDELQKTLQEQAAAVRQGDVTATDLVERALRRIQLMEPALHAYARINATAALARARQLDIDRDAASHRQLLYGVPLAIKDLFFEAGEPCAAGTRVLRRFRPTYTATVVNRLLAAGAVIIGRTQLTEGAYGAHHPDYLAPVNPWHPDYWSGVSSSGSGVTVAAGAVAAALGTDTGGSIRFPAAANGLVGLKPTFGRVSTFGSIPLAATLDHVGPLCRTVDDAATLLTAIAGYDPRDPRSRRLPALAEPELRAPLRFGVDWRYCETGVEDDVIAGVRLATDVLRGAGHRLVDRPMPGVTDALIAGWGQSCGFETELVYRHSYATRPEEFGPALSSLIELGRLTGYRDYALLAGARQQFIVELDRIFESVDLLVMPNMPVVGALETAMQTAPDPRQASFITFTAPFNYSGHPTLTLPIDRYTVDWRRDIQLPRSVQLIAPKGAEGLLLAVGRTLEREFAFEHGALRVVG